MPATHRRTSSITLLNLIARVGPRLLLTTLCALAPRAAAAQREIFSNWTTWFTISGESAINEHWGVMFDASIRRAGPLDEQQAVFERVGLIYEITPNFRVAMGANNSETWPYGKLPVAYPTKEHRTWQQVLLLHNVGRVALAHRYRLEQRWQGRRGADVTDPAVDHWMRTSRARYQIRALIPLVGQSIGVHQPYLTAAEEVFVSFGRNVTNNMFDQNRATAGLGWRLTQSWRSEVAYLEQTALKSDGVSIEENHTLTFTMIYTHLAHAREHQ